MQFRTKQGLGSLHRAHSFLVGRDVSVSTDDLKTHIEKLATMVDRIGKYASEREARARWAHETTDFKQALWNTLFREYRRPLARIVEGR